ncbi:MAG: DUF1385 domain-containing protein [FCB group bacterium]|nr:DUF1385 domain-containing protein [FCB group bacterium]
MKKMLLLLIGKPSILVGGQAVIEGVMMRVPGAYATAVRDPDGVIQIQQAPFTSRIESSALWKLPVLRGIMSLYEALRMGLKTLQWSADIALPEEAADTGLKARLANAAATLFAVGLAFTLFMLAPYWIATRLLHLSREAFWFNVAAGSLRILFFLVYLKLISLLKDVKRLFRYHGAEHKVVFNFESGKTVTVREAQSFSTHHPRCGTSFIFIVLLTSILFFALIDAGIIAFTGELSLGQRLLVHLPLIPLVAGLSYEIIKRTARPDAGLFLRSLRAPGLWLQRITTQPPEDDMVEVAITALKAAFGDRYEAMEGKTYIAEAIG